MPLSFRYRRLVDFQEIFLLLGCRLAAFISGSFYFSLRSSGGVFFQTTSGCLQQGSPLAIGIDVALGLLIHRFEFLVDHFCMAFVMLGRHNSVTPPAVELVVPIRKCRHLLAGGLFTVVWSFGLINPVFHTPENSFVEAIIVVEARLRYGL